MMKNIIKNSITKLCVAILLSISILNVHSVSDPHLVCQDTSMDYYWCVGGSVACLCEGGGATCCITWETFLQNCVSCVLKTGYGTDECTQTPVTYKSMRYKAGDCMITATYPYDCEACDDSGPWLGPIPKPCHADCGV